MSLEVGKESIDIGIVVRDIDAALRFYRDTVGLEYAAEMPAGGGRMHRLMCGSTVVKLVIHDKLPEKSDNRGGPLGASGIRYWTITVTDLQTITNKCRDAGYTVAVEPRDVRPGVRISMVEDPEGNWVEFLENNA